MFKDENEFKNIVDKLNIDTRTNLSHRKKLKQQMLSVFEETSQKQNTGQDKPDLWRKIMKSPFIKIATAAVIIIGILLLYLYVSNNRSLQNNETKNIAQENTDDNQIITPDTNRQDDELLLAKQLFEAKNIAGLSELLNSDFETVQMQIAEYLGQIGDETVLSELQILADKFDGSAQENVYANAISAIKKRLLESETEPESEEPPQVVIDDNEPDASGNNIKEKETAVTGIVIDENTLKPVQGASLTFDREKFVRSDENGEFKLVILVPWSQVPAGYSPEVPVSVTAAGYSSQRIVVHVEKDKIKEITIKLSPGSKLIGKVIDPNNQPIQGAEVCVLEYTTSIPVITDANGNFEIDGVNPAYPSPRVNVDHPLYPSVSIDFQPAQVGQSVYKEIVLKPGVIVFGQVTNSKGEPVKGVTVGNTYSPLMWNVKKYVTKDDGTYVLDNIDTEELILWAVHNNYAPFTYKTTIDLNQSQHEINIKLSDPFELKGKVLDSIGNPVTGAFVIMYDYNGIANIEDTRYPCKPDGTFIIPNAPKSGKLSLEVYGQSFTRKTHEVDFSLDEQIITINKSGRIYGQVVEVETGKPITAFHVRMTATRTGDEAYGYAVSWSEEGHTFNSSEGFFDTGRQSLPIGKQYRITISSEGYDPLTNDLVPVQPVSDRPERTQFMLKTATLKVGRVVNTNGQPIEKATIVFYPNEDISYDTVFPSFTTDEKGIYSVLGLGSEYQIIEVNAPGYAPNVALLDNITRQDGHFIDIVLDHGVSLSGYVYDEKGNGIANVAISVYIDPARTNNIRTPLANVRYAATTDENGFYQVQGIPSGKLLVFASNTQYYHRKKIELKSGQNSQLNFGNEKGFIISGITKAGQKHLSKAAIYLFSSENELLSRAISDAEGKFRLCYFEQNSYKIKIAWSSRNSDHSENWPENTSFTTERNLIVKQNIELDIDMQANTVKDIKTGSMIKEK